MSLDPRITAALEDVRDAILIIERLQLAHTSDETAKALSRARIELCCAGAKLSHVIDEATPSLKPLPPLRVLKGGQ